MHVASFLRKAVFLDTLIFHSAIPSESLRGDALSGEEYCLILQLLGKSLAENRDGALKQIVIGNAIEASEISCAASHVEVVSAMSLEILEFQKTIHSGVACPGLAFII